MDIPVKSLAFNCFGFILPFCVLWNVSSLSAQRHLHVDTTVPHGHVHRFSYITDVGESLPHGLESVYVYTPPGYDPASPVRYPVLYLLHGWLDNSSSWIRKGEANLILDTLIAEGKARPMIVVMPACYGDFKFDLGGPAVWLRPRLIDNNVDLFSQMLETEIIPKIERDYKVSKKREDHAIAGLSMGGLEAITVGLNNLHQFAWVAGFSAAVQQLPPGRFAASAGDAKRLKLLWVSYGLSDMALIVNGNRRLIAEFKYDGFPVTVTETPGGHNWDVWQYNLNQLLPLLFQPT
jgi:enterochelin esterase family protein